MNFRSVVARLIVMAAWFIAAVAFAGPNSALAAGPTIDHSSCGGLGVPNLFCSFIGSGDGAVIRRNSCNVPGACLNLGNDVHIGHDSCNQAFACIFAAGNNGSIVIGNNSCNDLRACFDTGYSGDSVIHSNSCNGPFACTGAAFDYNTTSVIGNDSCNSGNACGGAGDHDFIPIGPQPVTQGTIGNGSCNALGACVLATGVIGNGSCNAERACEYNYLDVGNDVRNRP